MGFGWRGGVLFVFARAALLWAQDLEAFLEAEGCSLGRSSGWWVRLCCGEEVLRCLRRSSSRGSLSSVRRVIWRWA